MTLFFTILDPNATIWVDYFQTQEVVDIIKQPDVVFKQALLICSVNFCFCLLFIACLTEYELLHFDSSIQNFCQRVTS